MRGDASVTVWGSGAPRREFLHVDDLADACVFLTERYSGPDFFNIGTGTDLSIADLSRMTADVVGYAGRIRFDTSKPDGTPRKLVDVSRIKTLGWSATIDLQSGMRTAYQDYLATLEFPVDA